MPDDLTTSPLSFPADIEALLTRAEALCVKRHVKLTALRRQILGLMLEAKAPLGAYDLLQRLQAVQGNAAPPTVYRTLEFLMEFGLIHKIERLSAFVPCTHTLGRSPCHDHDADCIHASQFLICRTCSSVTELEDPAILSAIKAASKDAGFRIHHSTVEVEGLCSRCAAAAA
ncbi:Fur family transcriptional regulator [Acetobacter conturbans]|uniref:Transcriptional repressor n=1 Tax=Acetobacter conturbans TaxID=1737472 RepID=A0ABX0JWH8_9PROT|nr:transcriptional repressor [Acetobacter conturbans]NHN87199.1 transcriptional repressor [Acetobacter conturbans]